MNIADIILYTLCLVWGLLRTRSSLTSNIWRGIRCFSSLFLSLHFYQFIAFFCIEKGWMQGVYVEETAFLSILISSYLVISFFIVLQSIIMEIKFIPLLDRPFGFFFGILEMYFIYLILLAGLILYPIPSDKIPGEAVRESKIAYWSIFVIDSGYNQTCERLGINKIFKMESFLQNKKDLFPDHSQTH